MALGACWASQLSTDPRSHPPSLDLAFLIPALHAWVVFLYFVWLAILVSSFASSTLSVLQLGQGLPVQLAAALPCVCFLHVAL